MPALSTMSIFSLCMKVQILIVTWLWFSQNFSRPLRVQNEEFSLTGHKVKVFLGVDYHFLDDCLGHQGSAATCPSSKDLVTLEHLRNHSGTAHTPEDCLILERTIEDLEASYNENLVDDRAGGLHKRRKFHESMISRPLFPIKSLCHVVPPVLHIELGKVLRLYQILLSKTQEKDNMETSTARADQEEKWKAFSLKVLLFQMMLTFNVHVVSHILLRIPFGITLLPSQKKIVNINAN